MSNWLGVRHCLLMYLDMRRWVKYQNSIVSVAGSHRLVLIFVLATVVPSSLGTTKFGKCTIYFPVGMLVSTTHECESNKDLITSLLTCTHSTSIMELSLHPEGNIKSTMPRVIQAVTQLVPPVPGHLTLERVTFPPSQKGHQQNCQVDVFVLKIM